MLVVENLVKSYGELNAVDDVSFEAGAGTVFGLLGPNGAGKSTAINCISGLLTPTAGRITVNGHDVVKDGKAARRALGVVPQEIALYEDLPAIENLRYWGKAYGLRGKALEDRVATVLETIGLADRAKDIPKEFSGGMKRRLNFGCGVVHEPKVLLLDEPTVGVDPHSNSFGREFSQRPGSVRSDPRCGRLRALHDALHGRGGALVRLARDHRPRQDHRKRYSCRA